MKKLGKFEEIDIPNILSNMLYSWKRYLMIIISAIILCCLYSYDVNQRENEKNKDKVADRRVYLQEYMELEDEVIENTIYKENSKFLAIDPYNVWRLDGVIFSAPNGIEDKIVNVVLEELEEIDDEKYLYEVMDIDGNETTTRIQVSMQNEQSIIVFDEVLKKFFLENNINYRSTRKCMIDLAIKAEQTEIRQVIEDEKNELENRKRNLNKRELECIEKARENNKEVVYEYEELSFAQNGLTYAVVVGIILGMMISVFLEWFKSSLNKKR